jgi:hypothetical protein
MMFPVFQVRQMIEQISDPNRKPAEAQAPRILPIKQVMRKMRWTTMDQVHQAQSLGLNCLITARNVGGTRVQEITGVEEEHLNTFREHIASIINAKLK